MHVTKDKGYTYLGDGSLSDKSTDRVVGHGESFRGLTCSIEAGSEIRCAHSGSDHLRVKEKKRWWGFARG